MPRSTASSVWNPAVNLPAAIRRSEAWTAPTMFLVALRDEARADLGRVRNWSVSTPIAQDAGVLHAARRAPLPVRPPAPKMTSAPASIICWAARLALLAAR